MRRSWFLLVLFDGKGFYGRSRLGSRSLGLGWTCAFFICLNWMKRKV